MKTNKAASIRQRLYNRARQEQEPFDARIDERKQRHGLQIASPSGMVPLEPPRIPR